MIGLNKNTLDADVVGYSPNPNKKERSGTLLIFMCMCFFALSLVAIFYLVRKEELIEF